VSNINIEVIILVIEDIILVDIEVGVEVGINHSINLISTFHNTRADIQDSN
jgi:hypothetical protein